MELFFLMALTKKQCIAHISFIIQVSTVLISHKRGSLQCTKMKEKKKFAYKKFIDLQKASVLVDKKVWEERFWRL